MFKLQVTVSLNVPKLSIVRSSWLVSDNEEPTITLCVIVAAELSILSLVVLSETIVNGLTASVARIDWK